MKTVIVDVKKMGFQEMTQEERINTQGGVIPLIIAGAELFLIGFEFGCIAGRLINKMR